MSPARAVRAARALGAARGRSGAREAERPVLALFALTVVGSALALGAVHAPVLLAALVLSWVAAALAVRQSLARRDEVLVPVWTLTLLALALFTALQAVPLPASLVAALSPSAADTWSRALLPFGEPGPRWVSLSLEPGATWGECVRLSTYGAVALAASSLSRGRTASRALLVVVASGLLVALVTIVHGALGTQKLYGLYAPRTGLTTWTAGPLVNGNTLAGYLNLAGLSALGLAAAREERVPGWVPGLAFAIMATVAVRVGSRGGLVALAVGLLVFGGLSLAARLRRGGKVGGVGLFAAAAALLAFGAFVLVGGTRHALFELGLEGTQKLRMVSWARPLVASHVAVGIGRGAFEGVFEAVRPERTENLVFTHAENVVVQLVVEWGVPVGLLALLALSFCLRPGALGAARRIGHAGAWAGIAALTLQNLADLGTEVPAVMIALSAVVGALTGAREKAAPSLTVSLSPRRARVVLGAAGALTLAAASLYLARGRTPLDVTRAELFAALERLPARDEAARARFRAELRAAMLARPAEAYFPLLGGTLALRAGDQSPMPWLQRALERAPLNGRAHLLAAEVLARMGARGQALLELKLAASYDADLVPTVGRLAARWGRSLDELLLAVPEGPRGPALLDAVATVLVGARRDGEAPDPIDVELSVACDLEALARGGSLTGPRYRVASFVLLLLASEDAAHGNLACPDRAACEALVADLAGEIDALEPQSSTGPQLLARLRMSEGRLDDAERVLEGGCARPRGRATCLALRLRVAELARDTRRFEAAARELVAHACAKASDCADAHHEVGAGRQRLGQQASAVSSFVRAAREDPSEARWLTVAQAAEEARLWGQAVDALDRVAKLRGGADPALTARLARARERAGAPARPGP